MEGGAASAGRRVGEISPDSQFRWGGAQWEPLPAGYREPTSWTRPLRLVTAGYLVLSVLYALITNALFLNPATIERAFRTSVPDASAEQVQQAVTVTVLLGWSFLLVVSVISLVLAMGSYRGWRWAFWGALVWLGLNSIGILTNLSTLTRSGTPPQPRSPRWAACSYRSPPSPSSSGSWSPPSATAPGPCANPPQPARYRRNEVGAGPPPRLSRSSQRLPAAPLRRKGPTGDRPGSPVISRVPP
jgi:hypothetical protein